MKVFGLAMIVVLAVGALAFWVRMQTDLPTVSLPTVESLVEAKPVILTASVANAISENEDQYVDRTGMILLDTAGGTSVPYIQYATDNEKVATRQLIFAGSRGCAANAGDLPCVAVDPDAAYPQYPTGTNVRVRGMQMADRILVYQIDVVTPAAN
ncbi:MAG: hypothetical protein AB202_00280 [Parcubacteria bacterium C7867-007]|nr:MAG: hypothetical protein AB202_00280 [Parcubacteria bacterium C7867-007]